MEAIAPKIYDRFLQKLGRIRIGKGLIELKENLKEFSADSESEKKTEYQSRGKKLGSDTSFEEKRDVSGGSY